MAYQDGDILIRAIMTNDNGLIEDSFINDFAFTKSLPQSSAEIDELFTRVSNFYRQDDTEGFAVSEFISTSVSRAVTHELVAYRIQAGGLGSPIASEPWLGPVAPISGSFNLPNEVAMCVSFHADLTGVLEESGATRPKARRRGRLYVGPLIREAVQAHLPNPVLNPTFGVALREGIGRIMDANDDAGSGGSFGVWSRKDATVRVVTGGWTDNAPDTLRKRGQKSSARVTFGS